MDGSTLRSVMGCFATGVTVLTTPGAHGHGMTANALTSVSLDPPLVLCCVTRSSRLHASLEEAGVFGVSILAADQTAAASWFAHRGRPHGAAQFRNVDHRLGARTGAPLITGALAWLEASMVTAYDGGDHVIVVGEVLDAAHAADRDDALLFHRGAFHRHEPPRVLRAA